MAVNDVAVESVSQKIMKRIFMANTNKCFANFLRLEGRGQFNEWTRQHALHERAGTKCLN